MSVTHNWFAAYLTDEEHALVLPHFTAALTKAIPREEEEVAMEYWREDPKRLGDAYPLEANGYNKIERINMFSSGFHLEGLVEFAQSIFFRNGLLGDFITEEVLFRLIMTNRNTPTAILWYALGFEIAEQLPGKRGNLLVHSSEVPVLLQQVNQLYKRFDMTKALEAAIDFAGVDVNEEELQNIITMIPDGLAEAQRRHLGITFLFIPQF